MDTTQLHLSRATQRGPLTVWSIFASHPFTVRNYVFGGRHLDLDEVEGGPVVEQLVATNTADLPALLLEAERLDAGAQHRMVARTTVVPAGATAVLPVVCCEAGRLDSSRRQVRGGQRAPASVRARLDDGQGAVWDGVGALQRRFAAESPTSSLVEVTAAREPQARELVKGLRPLPYACGVLLGVAGQIVLAEVFDHPRTLHEAWRGLLTSVAVEAVGLPEIETPGRRARRFLDRLADCSLVDAQVSGLATVSTAVSPYAQVRSTVWDGRARHLAALNVRSPLLVSA